MRRFKSLILLVIFSTGCASIMISDEMVKLFVRPVTDSIVAASVALLHQKEGIWPKDISETELTKQDVGTSEEKNDFDFQNTFFTENTNGTLTIDFDPSTEYHRRIVLEAPNSERSHYVGVYRNVDGSVYQISGTFIIDPATEPVSVEFEGGIKSIEKIQQ